MDEVLEFWGCADSRQDGGQELGGGQEEVDGG